MGCVEARHLEDRRDPADTDTAYPQHGDDHRCHRCTHAAQRPGGNIHHTTEEIRDAQEGQSYHAPADGFGRIGDVEGQQGGSCKVNNSGYTDAQYTYTAQADGKDFSDTLILFCTGVLADEIQSCLVEAVQDDI